MAQTKPKAGQFYGVSNNGTDGQFLKTDGTGGMSWDSPITNPTITSIDYPGSTTAANPAGGQSVIINGTLFASGITCTVGGTSAVTAFNSATQITITTPAKAAGPYTVAVTNPDGGTASQANFIQYSGVPVWSTAAGTLGNVSEGAAASFQVTATEGSDTIEYAVTTGTLPTGLSLATATGAITGTAGSVSADTTTTFSITATDDENQTSASRSFSITVQNIPPSDHFNTVLYSGNGGTQSITGLNFEPGLVWIKTRTNADGNFLWDTVRGTNEMIITNSTGPQYNRTGVTAFNSNGFTLGNYAGVNSSNNYVAWNFKAGGTAVANTVGSRSSEVSANNTLGFSIVKWAGNGQTATIGHGLSAAPELIMVKKYTGGSDWPVYSSVLTSAAYRLVLNQNSAQSTTNDEWNSTAPTSTVFSVGSGGNVSDNGQSFIGYCFTSKPGFSKVGSYTGNGSTNGPLIQTGFQPAFVMIKRTNGADNWIIQDDKRSPTNPSQAALFANLDDAEYATYGTFINFLANGFEIANADGVMNASGGDYLYLAFAADGSTTTPSLANSFATEIYTGNGGTKSVTTGFKPDFTWIKDLDTAYQHNLYDSIRGATNAIESNSNSATYSLSGLTSFDTTGFTLGSNAGNNQNGSPNVSWNWKAGGTPSINTDGSTTSLVSANQAAGFSIVKFSGNLTSAGNIQVGHGLNVAPELIIQKNLNGAGTWWARPFFLNSNPYQYLELSSSAALVTSSSSDGTMAVPTSTTFDNNWNTSLGSPVGVPIIAYCFKSISGYSKVGSYAGSNSNLQVNTGFQPTFLMLKNINAATPWVMLSSSYTGYLEANSNGVESDVAANYVSFNSTGFLLVGGTGSYMNTAGETWIYLAIKEN